MTTATTNRPNPRIQSLASVFKALSDPNRLLILSLLKKPGCCSIATSSSEKGMCACDIESQVDLSQPTISHHMRVLREAGLVHAEKVGPWMWYRRNEERLKELSDILGKN